METRSILWPRHPRLQSGEWLGSWLRRVAADNATSISGLLQDLGIQRQDVIDAPSPGLLRVLAERTGQDVDALAEAAQLPAGLLTTGGRNGETPRASLGIHLMQVCPGCLAQDAVPYVRRSWLDRHEVHCEQHGQLLDGCPHCGGQLRASFDLDRIWRNDGGDAPAGTTPITMCIWCSGDLSRPSEPHIEVPDVLPAEVRFIRRGNEWAVFLQAFELFVGRFGLGGLVQASQLVLGTTSAEKSTWVESKTGRVRHIAAETMAARLAAARTTTWVVQDNVQQRLQRFARVALIESESSNGWATGRPQLIRLWLLQALLDMPARDLRSEWPALLQGALTYMEVERPVAAAFTLTDEQWTLIEDAVAPDGNWNANNGSGANRALDRRAVMEQFLNALVAGRGTTSGRVSETVDGTGMWRVVTRLTDGAQLGFALGLLYRQLTSAMVQTRTRRGHTPAPYPTWQLATEALFLSDAMIELNRRVNPALHRELVGRVLLGRC